MRIHTKLGHMVLPVAGVLLSFLMLPTANAVPSFARQTGAACSACHTQFPQLTPFGRQFKLGGYTMTGSQQVKGKGLSIDLGAPLSMMIQSTWTSIKKNPDGDKTITKLPSQLSLFYAGRVTPKIGAFVQITAENGGGFGQDNTDVRYATTLSGSSPTILGIDINNNPTVQDVWNSTPAWGFPWFEAGFDNAFSSTMVGGALAQSVVGATVYGYWDNHVYGELGSYGAANSFGNGPVGTNACGNDDVTCDSKVVKGGAPYWRVAYTGTSGSNNYEIGAFGLNADVPTNGFTAPLDSFQDAAIDGQYQWILSNNSSVTVDANYIHEKQTLKATNPADKSQHLDTMKADVTYFWNQTYGVTLGYKSSTSSDGAVNAGDIGGFSTGKQDSNGTLLQFDITPWLNTRFAVQFINYGKVGGTSQGASDNNTVMLGAWILF